MSSTALRSLPSCSPPAKPVSPAALSALQEILTTASHRPVLSLSGAGLSTPSGLPDYRSPHRHASIEAAEAAAKKRTTHASFVGSRSVRQRYWARSFAGYARLSRARPNPAHLALARLHGDVGTLAITQNVDGLLQRAGLADVIELHGTLRQARCLECGAVEDRDALQVRMQNENEHLMAASEAQAAKPDGDAELRSKSGVAAPEEMFVVPDCRSCGANQASLMPDLVFHGGTVPPGVTLAARNAVDACGSMVVVGSTLMTWSGYSLALRVKEAGRPVVVVGIGDTRGDKIADLLVHGRVEDVLPALLSRMGEQAFAADLAEGRTSGAV